LIAKNKMAEREGSNPSLSAILFFAIKVRKAFQPSRPFFQFH